MHALTSPVRRLTACTPVLAALLLALTPAVAGATSPPVTVQAAAANAAFLAYAPAPPTAKALCLVDTGVNAVPDVAPGLVSATALDGGPGTDADPLTHGTIDAAVAGGAGVGVLGAWPQLKIVSVRGTDVPSPGQSPSYQYRDYYEAINFCTRFAGSVQIAAIDIPLSSTIPPTPDQSDEFANAVAQAKAKGISILAAAGNESGPIQLPANQPGIFAVGAGDGNAACAFSASTGLTFYAPGCGIDQISTTGETFCCGNGTSQASAFAAAVLVALRSYAPALTPDAAVQFLLSTTHNGHLDVAAAFRAAGLGAIVDAGTAAIPKSGGSPPQPAVPPPAARRVPRPSVKSVTWHRGVLTIALKSIAKGTRLHAKIAFAHGKSLYLATSHLRLRVRTRLPRSAQLRLTRSGASSATVSLRIKRR